MPRDFINIYELFLVFLEEGKYINTNYSLCAQTGTTLPDHCDGICYQVFYKY